MSKSIRKQNMKRFTFVVLILLTCHLTYGQETKLVTKKSNGFKEEFNVLVTDKKVKHGPYKKYEGKENLIIEGAYENNVKVGEWKFYINGGLEQTYDFTTKEVKYLKKSDYSSKALVNGTTQDIQLDTQPTYIGSKIGLNEELNKEMIYPHQALRMGIEGKVLASVWVSENGEVSGIEVIQGIMDECDNEVIKGLNTIEKNWVAGTKGGQKIKSELLIVVEFKLYDNGEKTITVL
jgi:TonB family protein